jgi:tartrate-resistant acid phosphatase type 5
MFCYLCEMQTKICRWWLFSVLLLLLSACRANAPAPPPLPTPPSAPTIRFAVIGDFGYAGANAAAVATLVKSWQPAFIVTTGDNNYRHGEAATIDENIGQYYHEFIAPYVGAYGAGGSGENRFFPVLGNHDWRAISCTGDQCQGPYFDYFVLPGHERYYELIQGPIHFFMLDSDEHEPHGIDAQSQQAQWLQTQMQASTAPWQIVVLHHAPFSSGNEHGSNPILQWPYQAWGADAVLAGHEHTYERLVVDDLLYLVNGLGGRSAYGFNQPIPESQVAYNDQYGALLVEGNTEWLAFRFINVRGVVIDEYRLERGQ